MEAAVQQIPKSTNDSSARIQEVFNAQKENLQVLRSSTARQRKKKLNLLHQQVK